MHGLLRSLLLILAFKKWKQITVKHQKNGSVGGIDKYRF